MKFTDPLPFSEAIESLHSKQLLPTDLSSAELRQMDADLRTEAIFSARTTKAKVLQKLKDLLSEMISGETNMATARLKMQQLYDGMGYTPEKGFPGDEGKDIPPAEAGSLRDLSSDRRLKLVLETNMRQVANRAMQRRGQSDFALYAWPCYELVRIYPRRVARGEEETSPSEGWPDRWEKCGGSFYGGGRMIARKDDDIWQQLGDSSRFADALDTDVPPFAFGSGYGWREVPREEAVALGVISADTDIQGRTSEREAAREIAADLDPEFLETVRDGLDVQAGDARMRLELGKPMSKAAEQLAPVDDFERVDTGKEPQ